LSRAVSVDLLLTILVLANKKPDFFYKDILKNVKYTLHLLLYSLHMKLENNLRRCRFDKNDISQEELANVIGVTRQREIRSFYHACLKTGQILQ
jgi:hypothetical protein